MIIPFAFLAFLTSSAMAGMGQVTPRSGSLIPRSLQVTFFNANNGAADADGILMEMSLVSGNSTFVLARNLRYAPNPVPLAKFSGSTPMPESILTVGPFDIKKLPAGTYSLFANFSYVGTSVANKGKLLFGAGSLATQLVVSPVSSSLPAASSHSSSNAASAALSSTQRTTLPLSSTVRPVVTVKSDPILDNHSSVKEQLNVYSNVSSNPQLATSTTVSVTLAPSLASTEPSRMSPSVTSPAPTPNAGSQSSSLSSGQSSVAPPGSDEGGNHESAHSGEEETEDEDDSDDDDDDDDDGPGKDHSKGGKNRKCKKCRCSCKNSKN